MTVFVPCDIRRIDRYSGLPTTLIQAVPQMQSSMTSQPTANGSRCLNCSVREANFCGSLLNSPSWYALSQNNGRSAQLHFSAVKDEVICCDGELSDTVFALCDGWAFRFREFTDGRRQILSILLPGDLFPALALLDPYVSDSVEALTDVELCQFGLADLKRVLTTDRNTLDALGNICVVELNEMNGTLADLGQRSVEERVVRLIQRLVARLSARNMMTGDNRYPFPLAHTHVADATGATPDEVGQVFAALHDNNIAALSNGVLTVLDPEKFRRVTLMCDC